MDSANIKVVTPFFMVGNIRRSLEFYVDGMSFRISNTWEPDGKLRWCWLEREAATGGNDLFAMAGQKEARMKIQAVAKIQYPIKSHNSLCNCPATVRGLKTARKMA